MNISQVQELSLAYSNGRQKAIERLSVGTPKECAAMLMARYTPLPYECFRVVCLDTKHRVIGVYEVGKGGLDTVGSHPRDVFVTALLARAASVVLTHNHPSGDPAPSAADVTLTTRMVQAGELIGVDVLDHIHHWRG